MKALLIFILATQFLYPLKTYGASDWQDSNSYDAGRLNSEGSYFVPFELSPQDLAKVGVATTMAVVFFANDREILNFTQRYKGQVSDKFAFVGRNFGNAGISLFLGGGYILGVVTDNERVKKYVLLGAKTVLIASIVTGALKMMIHRPLPNQTTNPYTLDNPSYSPVKLSFPSGHATSAFAFATFLAETSHDKTGLIPVLAYSAALITGWERMRDNHHWPSDIVIGALIGHLVAKNFLSPEIAKKGFMITPMMDGVGGFGVSITYVGRPTEDKSLDHCADGYEGDDRVRACIDRVFAESFQDE